MTLALNLWPSSAEQNKQNVKFANETAAADNKKTRANTLNRVEI